MLTATYTLVALSVEQASVRVSLQSLEKLLQSNFADQDALTPGQVGSVCEALQRLYETCHWRKLEMFLIPAIRRATREADQLLLDLDELSRAAGEAMSAIAATVESVAIDSHGAVAELCEAIHAFCSATLQRLQREEDELFPVARAAITGEAWFSIAHAMLQHDAHQQETKSVRKPILLGRPAVPDIERVPHDRARQQRFAATFAH